MKRLFSISILIFALLCAFTQNADAKVKRTKRNGIATSNERIMPASEITDINELMQAPKVTPNKDGFINRRNAPQNNAHLRISISQPDRNRYNDLTIKFYINNKLTQKIDCELFLPYMKSYCFYLDLNYDGYTDVFIAPRTSNISGGKMFLWNPKSKEFDEMNVTAEYFTLHPASKTINFSYHGVHGYDETRYEKCNAQLDDLDEIIEFPIPRSSRCYYYVGDDVDDYPSFNFDKPDGITRRELSKEWIKIIQSFK